MHFLEYRGPEVGLAKHCACRQVMCTASHAGCPGGCWPRASSLSCVRGMFCIRLPQVSQIPFVTRTTPSPSVVAVWEDVCVQDIYSGHMLLIRQVNEPNFLLESCRHHLEQ